MEIIQDFYLDNNVVYIKYTLSVYKYKDNSIAFSCFITNTNFDNIKDLINELKKKYNEEEYNYSLKDIEENKYLDINDSY